ncbi:MAG: thioredoxin family protein [Bacillota bacterium]|nr:thioredoxin family protein [Bacillota bacterium]
MEIKVLGSGCARCQAVEQEVKAALAELGVAAEVTKVTEVSEIISYGVAMTPGLVINGKVRACGRVPSREEIKRWISEERG